MPPRGRHGTSSGSTLVPLLFAWVEYRRRRWRHGALATRGGPDRHSAVRRHAPGGGRTTGVSLVEISGAGAAGRALAGSTRGLRPRRCSLSGGAETETAST